MNFEAPKQQRINRYIWVEPDFDQDVDLWWSYQFKKWLPLNETGTQGSSSAYYCHSLRAFRKHLKRHPELKGIRMLLVSRFVGCSVTATGR